jgi:hypothetical protein
LLAKYDKGLLVSDDFVARRGKLTLGIEKDKARKYPDNNTVADYVCAPVKAGGELRFKT